MSIFYRKTKTLNAQKTFNAQTIFVSNHPSAFIDPLVAGNYQLPVLYFVTRGDIFKTWLKPITWASHMVPIFRKAQDGADSHKKNKDSFLYLRKVLLRKKSLILFGEGYTDDIFIRSLKPLKKGPARIGFDTMKESNWEIDIKVQALGINYTHPKHLRSDVLVSFGELISLKDYKEQYKENPNHAIAHLTKAIQGSLQEQITYVKDKELAPFVEQILILSRKGMNHFHNDSSIPLEDRYHYSKRVARKINNEFDINTTKWADLKQKTTTYFKDLKSYNINENWVHNYNSKGAKTTLPSILFFILTLPITLFGLVHNLIPYLIIKRFVENTFKRDVFWSGVKLLLGAVLALAFNIWFIFLFHDYLYPSYWIAIAYFLLIPALTGVFAYTQIKKIKDALANQKADESILKKMVSQRNALIEDLKSEDLI